MCYTLTGKGMWQNATLFSGQGLYSGSRFTMIYSTKNLRRSRMKHPAVRRGSRFYRRRGQCRVEMKRFQKGDVIFEEGSFGRELYEIKSGSVAIIVGYGKPEERKLTELEAGRIFGEMALIEVYPRSATAVAVTDVEAEEVSVADMQRYFEAHPEKLMEIMRALSRRLRELTADYREVCGAIGEWKDVSDQGGKKGGKLMAALKKFADFFEPLKYVDYSNPMYIYSGYHVY